MLARLIEKGWIKKRWLKKGLWAGLDQGLFAGSNFAVNIVLANWLTPYGYGAFGLAFAVFLFVGCLHQAMLLEPMLVFGPGRYKERMSEYLGVLVYGHFAFVALGGIALMLTGLGFSLWGSGAIATVMLALALTEPFILLLWLMRRACYTRLEPHLAAWGSAWYMVLMLAGTYAVYAVGWLSAASALGVMAISSLVVSIWLSVRLRVKYPPLRRDGLLRDAFGHHLKYGRWSVANNALNWVPQNIGYLVLPIWGGLAAGASFRALMNLIRPVLQAAWALSNLLLPTFVQARSEGHAEFGSRVRSALVFFTIGPTLYWVALGLFHQPLISLLYNGRYTADAWLLWVLGLSPVLAMVKLVLGYSVRALERPDWLFVAYALPAVAALTVGTGLVYLYGLAGAAVGLLLSQAITAALVTVLYRRLRLSSEASYKGDMSTETAVGEER